MHGALGGNIDIDMGSGDDFKIVKKTDGFYVKYENDEGVKMETKLGALIKAFRMEAVSTWINVEDVPVAVEVENTKVVVRKRASTVVEKAPEIEAVKEGIRARSASVDLQAVAAIKSIA